MTRTNAFRLWLATGLVAAFAATPAMASDGYESVSAITGPVEVTDDRGYESISAITGPVSEGPSSAASRGDGYSSPAALVGAEPTPTSLVEVRESNGFDWGDALIGALVATGLTLSALGGARLVGQSRRRPAESSA